MSQPEFGLGLRGDTPHVDRLARLAEDGGFPVISVFNDLGFGDPLPVALAASSVTTQLRFRMP